MGIPPFVSFEDPLDEKERRNIQNAASLQDLYKIWFSSMITQKLAGCIEEVAGFLVVNESASQI